MTDTSTLGILSLAMLARAMAAEVSAAYREGVLVVVMLCALAIAVHFILGP